MNNFSARTHASPTVQQAIDLASPNCDVPRIGDRTREGEQNFDRVGCVAHMSPFVQDEARIIWNVIPQQNKDNPTDADQAAALVKLAHIARRAPPPNCVALLPGGDVPPTDVTYYAFPGGPIIVGKTHANKYIAFIYINMDEGHRVAYHQMTGKEQWEWYDAWLCCNRTHIRVEQETRGLCGTDLERIQNVAQLREALLRSPSSADRRPANHAIGQGVWNGTVRQLFP